MKRTKRMLALLLALVMCLSLAVIPAGAASLPEYAADGTMTELYGGAKTEAGVYSISSADELKALSSWTNAGNDGEGFTFFLTDDIALGGDGDPWVPIGQFNASDYTEHAFAGTFDGCGHEISGLYIGGDDYTGGSGIYNEANGLFGVNLGTVQNVAAEVEINTYRCGGGIAGHNGGVITACKTTGTVAGNGRGSTRGSGGIAGDNYGTVTSCYSACIVTENGRGGGIVGFNQADAGSVSDCFFTGTVSADNNGGVAGISEGTVTDCYWKDGCCPGNTAFNGDTSANTFDGDGTLTGTTDTLLSVLSENFTAGAAGLPLLFWEDAVADTFHIAITQPEAGGTLAAACGDETVTGSAYLPAGSSVTLTATAPDSGYFFKGFSIGGAVSGGTENGDGSYTASFTVTADAEVTALYTSLDDAALTIATQIGEKGSLTAVKSYSYNDLFAMAGDGQSAAGYMYTHGDDGWSVVGATQYVSVADLLADANVTPADTDEIVAMASDGSPKIIPDWKTLSGDLYFYADAADTATFPTTNAAVVPAAIALRWGTGKSGETAGDKLAAAAADAVFSGKLRFVYGSAEADYVDIVNAGGTITGNRLWSGVETLVVRSVVDADSMKISVFGTDYSLSDLQAYETAADFTMVRKGVETTYSVRGITAGDLITKVAGLEETACASLSFADDTGFTSTAKMSDYALDDIMLIWDGADATSLSLRSAVNGGGGNLWCSGVVTVTGEQTAFRLGDISLSLADLKAYPTTAVWKMKGADNEITGVTMADLLENFAPEAGALGVTFYASPSDKSAEVLFSEYPADKVMVAWDGAGASDASLRSAVDGGSGKMWWSGVTGCEFSEAELTIGGVGFTKGMLTAKGDLTDAVWVKKGDDVTVTGITLKAVAEAYPDVNAEKVYSVTFADDTGFASTYVLGDDTLENAAVIWKEGESDVFKSAVNGAAGKLWVSDVTTVSFEYFADFTITPTPAGASVTVKDAEGGVVAPNADGTFPIVTGQTYTYEVSADGYTAKSDAFVPAAGELTLAVTLNAQGGGGEGGGGGGTPAPAEETVFSVYLQEGSGGTPVLAKTFVKSEVNGVLQTGTFPYLYYKNGGWAAIVATKVLTLEDIVVEAGATGQWKSGSYLKFTCTDGEYEKSYPTYDDIRNCAYCFDSDGTATVVPAGVAIEWDAATVGSSGSVAELTSENYGAIAATARDTGKYRLVYGTSEALFNSANEGGDAPAGARSPTGIISMTIVYDAESVPEGSVGTSRASDEEKKTETKTDAKTVAGFEDVHEDDWFAEAVSFVTEKKLFQGTDEKTFSPAMAMSRAMITTVLYRCAGSPAAGSSTFGDVESGSWYADAVAWASEHGIVTGTGEGFAPAADVTREQLVVILYRFAKTLPVDTAASGDLGGFTDADKVSPWAEEAMRWAVGAGIICGRDDKTLDPAGSATRAEVAAVMMRFDKLTESKA